MSDFTHPVNPPGSFILDRAQVLRIATAAAPPTNENLGTRPILTCVSIRQLDGHVIIQASDAHRYHAEPLYNASSNFRFDDSDVEFLLDAAALTKVARGPAKDGEGITVNVSGRRYATAIRGRRSENVAPVAAELLANLHYPDFSRPGIIPDPVSTGLVVTTSFTGDLPLLDGLTILSRGTLPVGIHPPTLVDEESGHRRFAPGTIPGIMWAGMLGLCDGALFTGLNIAEAGMYPMDYVDSLDPDSTRGRDLTYWVDPTFLADLITSVIDAPDFSDDPLLELSSPRKPAVIRSGDAIRVLMPVRN